ncbi:MAG TPA: agmatine deiminase family protein [Polyangia bacterium]
MPGEWEPHDATWLAFPHNVSDWPGRFGPIPWVYGDIIKKVTAGEVVNLLVNDATHETKAKRVLKAMGVDGKQVHFRRFPTNRIWARDFGPIFVREGAGAKASVAIARFHFNAWAKYPDWRRDDKIPERAAKALKVNARAVRHAGRDVVLEGGAIDVNGAGTMLTTEECLLDPKVQVRNPGFSRDDYEAVFRDALGISNTIWLNKGIAGDDTHGHVDDLARFVDRRTIVLCQERNGNDANHRPLAENWERLEGARLEDGSRPEVVALPMPAPLAFAGQRVPASYANFYICNAAVLVPTFNDPADRAALGILAELIPDRPVVGIHALDLVWGLGTLHCMSQQQPRA